MKKWIGFCLCLLLTSLCAAGLADVVLNASNFPDTNFRDYLSSMLGKEDGDTITDEEIAGLTEIRMIDKNISDLTGIGYFHNLTTLNINNTRTMAKVVKEVDLSKNTKLTTIYMNRHELTKLDVSMCKNLEKLSVSNNDLETLILPNNSALTELDCDKNWLTELNISGCTALRSLYCGKNRISRLDVSASNSLRSLSCGSNPLTGLKLASSLKNLYCVNTTLSTLDIYDCPTLVELSQREPELKYSSDLGMYYLSYYTTSYTMNVDEGVFLNTEAPSSGQQDPGADSDPGSDPAPGSDPGTTPGSDPGSAPDSEPGIEEQVTLKKIKISKVTVSSKKKIKVQWKKLSKKVRKQAKMIEVQVSPDKSFQTDVITKRLKSSKTSVSVSGLKKNTKYYVRIRVYTEDGNIRYVSPWSSVKKVKTKKK